MPAKSEIVEVNDLDVKIANPDKLFFAELGLSKMDVVRYYLSVGPGVLNGVRDRPTTLYRWPNGVDAPDDAFYQKRVPQHRPEWIRTQTVTFPSGRSAEMLVGADLAHVIWAVNLGCIDFNPWPVRQDDVDHPDELRVDLDPTPGISYGDVIETAKVVRTVLEDHELAGWIKTSGKRGMHVYIRIEPRWSFTEVRRAALALAREVERRADGVATTAWWKEQRHGVFVDYNQNARDRTIASVYSVRPFARAQVSCPIEWEELDGLDPQALTISSVPERFAERDPWEEMDRRVETLDSLLDLARRDEAGGLGDAPWPPHFPKAEGEPARVQPSRRKRA
jgi:bifunctional non-homologous end joining protein LigD